MLMFGICTDFEMVWFYRARTVHSASRFSSVHPQSRSGHIAEITWLKSKKTNIIEEFIPHEIERIHQKKIFLLLLF